MRLVRPPSSFVAVTLAATALLTGSGCLQNVVVDETFAAARRASKQAETLQDFEIARQMTYAGVGQLEGLHWMRPSNPTGLFMLTKAWCGVGQAFVLDDYEQALERDDELDAEYHLLRARAAFERAKFYGLQLLFQHASGFSEAATKQSRLRVWLREHLTDREDAEWLLWLGVAWLGYVSVDTENSQSISELWVGVELMEHVIRLDETVEYGMAHVVLGGYHARLMGELDEAKVHLDRALVISGGRFLAAQLTLATRYYCTRHDEESYRRTLRAVLSAGDTLPAARLANTVAKRRARRYLASRVFQEECGFEVR